MITGVLTYAYWSDSKKKIMFRLQQDVVVDRFIIPNGYETDFATVPRWLWSFFPPIGRHNIASLVHDYLYDNQIGTRKQADDLFLRLMLAYNVNKIAAYLMYLGVRLGAKKWWDT
jgi:hypothetical protein